MKIIHTSLLHIHYALELIPIILGVSSFLLHPTLIITAKAKLEVGLIDPTPHFFTLEKIKEFIIGHG